MLTAGASGGPLIGRDSVLSVFDQRLDALQAGRGSAVLLVGEPGLGKTRLLEELTVRARRRGLVSAWGRSSEGGSGEPYGPWRWVLRSFGLSVTAGASREAWVADVLNALAVAAQSKPLVVCLDDLHWADEASLRLLHAALTVVGDVPMLLAGARRLDVVDGALAGAELLAALPAAVSRIAVEPLTLGQVDELVALVGGPLPATVLTRVAERTGGNPFLVQEVATLLAESPAALDTAVPAGVHDLLGRRLARLPAGCLEVLAVLSVLGGEAQIDELAAVYGDTDVAVRGELDPAVRAGLVRLTRLVGGCGSPMGWSGMWCIRRSRPAWRRPCTAGRRRPCSPRPLRRFCSSTGGSRPGRMRAGTPPAMR